MPRTPASKTGSPEIANGFLCFPDLKNSTFFWLPLIFKNGSSFKTACSLPFCANFCRSFKKEQHPQGLVRDGYSPDQETAEGSWPVEAVQSGGLLAQALGLSLSRRKAWSRNFSSSPPPTWSPPKALPVRPVMPLSHCHGEPQGLPTVSSQPWLISGHGARGTERGAHCLPLSHVPMRPA